jgi:hypothetical protein
MNKLFLAGAAALTLTLAGCDDYSGEAPVDQSPVAPEVVCGDPVQQDNDSALECDVPDNEVSDYNIGDAVA